MLTPVEKILFAVAVLVSLYFTCITFTGSDQIDVVGEIDEARRICEW